ncbi:MAG: hypothetical protein M9962_00190 [Oligoflexia bacterium]|nr:hypothetical protein [Oligoflexia bacterium]
MHSKLLKNVLFILLGVYSFAFSTTVFSAQSKECSHLHDIQRIFSSKGFSNRDYGKKCENGLSAMRSIENEAKQKNLSSTNGRSVEFRSGQRGGFDSTGSVSDTGSQIQQVRASAAGTAKTKFNQLGEALTELKKNLRSDAFDLSKKLDQASASSFNDKYESAYKQLSNIESAAYAKAGAMANLEAEFRGSSTDLTDYRAESEKTAKRFEADYTPPEKNGLSAGQKILVGGAIIGMAGGATYLVGNALLNKGNKVAEDRIKQVEDTANRLMDEAEKKAEHIIEFARDEAGKLIKDAEESAKRIIKYARENVEGLIDKIKEDIRAEFEYLSDKGLERLKKECKDMFDDAIKMAKEEGDEALVESLEKAKKETIDAIDQELFKRLLNSGSSTDTETNTTTDTESSTDTSTDTETATDSGTGTGTATETSTSSSTETNTAIRE